MRKLALRRTKWKPLLPEAKGGYQQLYIQHVMQASEGADLDFLVGCRGHDGDGASLISPEKPLCPTLEHSPPTQACGTALS